MATLVYLFVGLSPRQIVLFWDREKNKFVSVVCDDENENIAVAKMKKRVKAVAQITTIMINSHLKKREVEDDNCP